MQPDEPYQLADDHLSDPQLRMYQDEAMPPDECERADAHFGVCRDGRCMQRLKELSSLASGPDVESVPSVPPALEHLGYVYEREANGAVYTPPGVSAEHGVYLALRIYDRLRVVIKFMREEFTDAGPSRRLYFIGEPAATHQLMHPNIVDILDFQSVNGRFFYVMEYVGPSLSRYQSGVPFWACLDLPEAEHFADAPFADEQTTAPYLPSDTTLNPNSSSAAAPLIPEVDAELLRGRFRNLTRWVIELAETIETINGRNILHRDLKPDNILVREGATRQPAKLIITDFGILHHLNVSSTALESTPIGTRNFMAPEQLDNTQDLTKATDIYGLGSVFYFMLTGKAPLRDLGRNWQERVRTERPEEPCSIHSCIPVGLQAVCMKALEKDPRRRYQSGRENLLPLDNLTNSGDNRASRVPPFTFCLGRIRHGSQEQAQTLCQRPHRHRMGSP